MDDFDKSVVTVIIAIISMLTIMFSLTIGLECYKVKHGITKQCQCNK